MGNFGRHYKTGKFGELVTDDANPDGICYADYYLDMLVSPNAHDPTKLTIIGSLRKDCKCETAPWGGGGHPTYTIPREPRVEDGPYPNDRYTAYFIIEEWRPCDPYSSDPEACFCVRTDENMETFRFSGTHQSPMANIPPSPDKIDLKAYFQEKMEGFVNDKIRAAQESLASCCAKV